jgi:hypothetical protein
MQLGPGGITLPQQPAAQAAPAPQPSLDPSFLLLPSFETHPAPVASPSAKTLVGDRLGMIVSGISLPGSPGGAKDLKLDVPPGSDSLADLGWDVLVGKPDDGAPANELRFTAVPLKPGRLELPSLALKDSSGKNVGRTQPLSVEVTSAIKADDPKPEEPVELKPPLSLRFPWWVIVALALVVCALAAAGVWAARRWSGKKAAPELPPIPEEPKPEDELALAALEEIERQGFARRGEFKPHYFRVSEVLKEYVGRRFRMDALEMTSREIIMGLEEARGRVPEHSVDNLEALFEALDLVKFTDHKPTLDAASSALSEARRFVLATRRPPQIISAPSGTQSEAPTNAP